MLPPPLPPQWPRRRLEPEHAAADRDLLANLQGNIVRSHGRSHARLLTFSFGPEAPVNRQALVAAAPMVTSALRQWREARAFRAAQAAGRAAPPNVFCSLAVSAVGLRTCGLHDAFPPGLDRPAAAFARGMAADHAILGDPSPNAWDAPWNAPVDGVWLLASESVDAFGPAFLRLQAWLESCGGQIRGIESCFHWRPDPTRRWACREPFGFADGISNPEFVAGTAPNHWSIDLGLDRVLIEEPGRHQGGSFLVVRKLEQNVAAFRAFESKLAATLRESLPAGQHAVAARLAEAALIGRDREGLPLAELAGDDLNDFSFTGDAHAQRCPFHAHIRKANPRDDHPYTAALAVEDARRFQFVRRSMVYGDPGRLTLEGPDWPAGGVGLCFMGYMRDIEEQFREMQARWMRDRHFPGENRDGLPDPLLFGGMPEGGEPATTWRWSRDDHTTSVPGLAQFVRPRGGEYFYVPALTWLAGGGTGVPS